MRLPENVTVYVGGKKFVRNIPDELAPEHLKGAKADTKPLKKIVAKDKAE